ncbi:GNAT family N-acetyltransferase [Synechococcales cyanobacterium C]|uniref:GNAT family N-acetyltransferase n=1 Tax=Petrachloros mirabilis ULC683 TaxID=2781853 RepID=A0A8K2A6Y4_9CYAN|nr:GNAT family N-acetyltransferase [Petrachloros mirabilis]NCJ06321.1 GNAT family N-acetyltransferase [Petrachloros mirabilis ULC683]
MTLTSNIQVATSEQDRLIAQHFYQMWRDNQIPDDAIAPDWETQVLDFIIEARATLAYQAFVAQVADQVVGSVGCQRFAGLYPNVFRSDYRCDGYIWGVYVVPAYRRQGIASALTQTAADYLISLGCTQAMLNASPSGQRPTDAAPPIVRMYPHPDLRGVRIHKAVGMAALSPKAIPSCPDRLVLPFGNDRPIPRLAPVGDQLLKLGMLSEFLKNGPFVGWTPEKGFKQHGLNHGQIRWGGQAGGEG